MQFRSKVSKICNGSQLKVDQKINRIRHLNIQFIKFLNIESVSIPFLFQDTSMTYCRFNSLLGAYSDIVALSSKQKSNYTILGFFEGRGLIAKISFT